MKKNKDNAKLSKFSGRSKRTVLEEEPAEASATGDATLEPVSPPSTVELVDAGPADPVPALDSADDPKAPVELFEEPAPIDLPLEDDAGTIEEDDPPPKRKKKRRRPEPVVVARGHAMMRRPCYAT